MYRSKEVEYMNTLKSQVNQLTFNAGVHETFNEAWDYLKKYVVLDDLQTFLMAQHLNNQIEFRPEYIYNGNLEADVMFVTASEHPSEMKILKALTDAANIKNYYRTSYIKHNNLLYYKNNPHLSQVINNEINIVKPKVVVFFGLNIANWSVNATERHKEILHKNIPVVVTSSLIDLLSNKNSENEKIAIKNYIWDDITKFIKK